MTRIYMLYILTLQGDEMVNYLQGDYLPTHRLSPDQAREFCDALKSDTKLFRNYFKVTWFYCILFRGVRAKKV